MSVELLEEYQEKKKKTVLLAEKACDLCWITKERKDEIIKKINDDVLTIGVIGQMKCGKSTFLNSFVFENDILPSATTPMTAALSKITYGDKERISAEFYSEAEWNEQKMMASRSEEEVSNNELEVSKIRAAKELMEKSVKLGSDIKNLLGKTQDDSFENLKEYVGADGKYVSITKSVKIFYPKDYLKGVEIVDTPGMNDPIVSREERTKEFLFNADVVVMMLYAGRPFDKTDHTILFENVRKCGIGKVLVGVNKYDIPYMNGETEDAIQNYVSQEIQKACSEYKDDTISDIVKDVTPILLSANMALLSQLPMSKITASETYSFDWKRYCDMFEISTQKQFAEKSKMHKLAGAITSLIENEKGSVLFVKPKNEILAAGNSCKLGIEKKLLESKNKIKILQMPDSEIDEKLHNLERADKRMNKRLIRIESALEDAYNDEILTGKQLLKTSVEKMCEKMTLIVDESGMFKDCKNALERKYLDMVSVLNRNCEDIIGKLRNSLRSSVNDLLNDISDIAREFLSDFETSEFIEMIKANIKFKIGEDFFSNSTDLFNQSSDLFNQFSDVRRFLLDVSCLLDDIFNRKEKLHSKINQFQRSFSVDSFITCLHEEMEKFLQVIKKDCIDEVINPLRESLEEVKNKTAERDSELKKLDHNCADLQKELDAVVEQIKQVEAFCLA